MRPPDSARVYARPGTVRILAAGLLWLAFAIGATAVLMFVAAIVTSQIKLPRTDILSGQVSRSSAVTPISWPAGVPIGEFAVSPGDTVRVGQTIMTLDVPTLEAQLSVIRRRILAKSVLRQCLLGRNTPGGEEPSTARWTDAETRLQVTAALEECRVQTAVEAADANWMSEALDLLRARERQLSRKLLLEFELDKGPTALARRARVALDLTLERNEVRKEAAVLAGAIAGERNARMTKRLAKIKVLAEEVARDLRLEARLAGYVSAPRVPSPSDGVVARIRPLATGAVSNTDIYIGEITHEQRDEPIARVFIPPSRTGTLSEGETVLVHVSGTVPGGTNLPGIVEVIEPASTIGLPEAQLAEIRLLEVSPEDSGPPDGNPGRASPGALDFVAAGTEVRVELAQPSRTIAEGLVEQVIRLANVMPRAWRELTRDLPSSFQFRELHNSH